MDLVENIHGTGGIPSEKDKRDFQWDKIAVGMASAPFDWSIGFDIEAKLGVKIPVKDQNGSYSCGGQAMATYEAVLNAIADGKLEERSAKFIYAQVHYPDGGSTGRDLMDNACNEGFGLESLTSSYQNGLPPTEAFMIRREDITQEAFEYAKKERGLSYATISTTDIDSIAQAIRDNNGALIGVCGQNGKGWSTSAFPGVPTRTDWRHWIYAGGAKIINGKKYIKIINSWGNKVGEVGWQWICEEYFTSGNCFEARTLVYNVDKPINAFKHTFNLDIARGATGDEVMALQAVLRLEGLFNYPLDTGNYGIVTQDAVYKFQIKYNIAPFSRWLYRGFYCGPATRAVLNQKYGIIK